jgi:hypothetical protein
MTETEPAERTGVVQVSEVSLAIETPVQGYKLPPKVTVAPVVNPLPVIVTEVPPLVTPSAGSTKVTTGGGT